MDSISDKLVSVVICTYNRKEYLKKCIDSLLIQTYSNFEIIIVYTPSNDSTEQLLLEYPQIQKIYVNNKPNLSISRNIGIYNSNGEIIIFIDDDAIADKQLISNLIKGYEDESIGGVSGCMKNENGTEFQLRGGYVDLMGDYFLNDPLYLKDNNKFKLLVGGNCSFNTKILKEIGGFDEYFNFFYDDFDISIRLYKAGYKILYCEDAIVFHARANSVNRRNYYDEVKNHIYFVRHNFIKDFTEQDIVCIAQVIRDNHIEILKNNLSTQNMTNEEFSQYKKECIEASKFSILDAQQKVRHLNYKL